LIKEYITKWAEEKGGGYKPGKNPYAERILPFACWIRFWKLLQHRL
jgi:hypothetical protein